MTSRMTSLDLFEQFDCLNDLLIAEAEIPDAHKATVLPTPRSKGRLSSFVNSGWGVAIVCALVAVSVMGGIIWAGFRAGHVPPGHNDIITSDVYLTAGKQTVPTEAFFASSEVHKGNQTAISCGAGFDGVFTMSPVPTLTYTKDLRLHMPDNHTLEAVYVYDPEAPTVALYTFESADDLGTLKAGTYYVALRITHMEGKSKYVYDYAFCLEMAPQVEIPLMKQPHEWPVFDPPAKDFLDRDQTTFPQLYHLTAAYTQARMTEGMAWYVMAPVIRGYSGMGDRLHISLYDPESGEKVAEDTQLGFLFPYANTILQLEDGRLITLHGGYVPNDDVSFEVIAHVWMWSKVDPDTGEELEEIQLCPMGETWSYTFDLTDPPAAMKGWEYAFATYIYGLTEGEPPTLRVLLDNLFCETDEVKYDLAQYEPFSEDENLTTGWARLQRIMNGELRPDLWVQPEVLDLSFCEFALGHRLHVKFQPDGYLWILIGQLDAIHEIYKGTYVLGEGQITIDCPMDTNYFGLSLHGTHTFEQSEESVRIGELTVPRKGNDSTCPAVFVPLIMAYFDAYNASVPEYRQDQPEGYAVMDMDGDGTKEVVVKLAWDQKTAYDRSVVFFIDYDAEKILDHAEISYNHLYVDGAFSYTLDRTGPSYGVDKLVATETGYVAQPLWRIYNDGTENAEYYLGDRKVTKEELDAYTAEIECEKVTWSDCTWKITESETDFHEETENGKG